MSLNETDSRLLMELLKDKTEQQKQTIESQQDTVKILQQKIESLQSKFDAVTSTSTDLHSRNEELVAEKMAQSQEIDSLKGKLIELETEAVGRSEEAQRLSKDCDLAIAGRDGAIKDRDEALLSRNQAKNDCVAKDQELLALRERYSALEKKVVETERSEYSTHPQQQGGTSPGSEEQFGGETSDTSNLDQSISDAGKPTRPTSNFDPSIFYRRYPLAVPYPPRRKAYSSQHGSASRSPKRGSASLPGRHKSYDGYKKQKREERSAEPGNIDTGHSDISVDPQTGSGPVPDTSARPTTPPSSGVTIADVMEEGTERLARGENCSDGPILAEFRRQA